MNILVDLGHTIAGNPDIPTLQCCDLLVAMHARKSYTAVALWRKVHPRGGLILVLPGTDLYRDIRTNKRAQHAMELADRMVVLQERGVDEVPTHLRSKVRVIYQSAVGVGTPRAARGRKFKVIVLGHLRHEKDPFRSALALRKIPADVPIELTHLGQALSEPMERRARRLMEQELRYQWKGEVSSKSARRALAGSDLMVISSRMEGGANVVSEALVEGVPILASAIPGNVGILGEKYPGYYPVGDAEALGHLLLRAATDETFYNSLKLACSRLTRLVEPKRESMAWKKLLTEVPPVFRSGGFQPPN
jgi:putative glycosyltransferase (TIGR04348 family)